MAAKQVLPRNQHPTEDVIRRGHAEDCPGCVWEILTDDDRELLGGQAPKHRRNEPSPAVTVTLALLALLGAAVAGASRIHRRQSLGPAIPTALRPWCGDWITEELGVWEQRKMVNSHPPLVASSCFSYVMASRSSRSTRTVMSPIRARI